MPEPTEEEKKLQEAVDAELKKLGYDDHAKKVIERTNAEAKTRREALELAETELKKFRDAEKARKDEDDKRKADEEKARKAAEDEKKTLQERLDGIEKNFADKLTAAEQVAAQKQAEFLDELKARDSEILMQAVRAAATKRGIIDEDLVSMLDVSKITIERGKPTLKEVEELIEAHATSKPHLYRSEDERNKLRDAEGRFVRAKPADKTGDVDASKLSDAEFDVLTEKLRTGRA